MRTSTQLFSGRCSSTWTTARPCGRSPASFVLSESSPSPSRLVRSTSARATPGQGTSAAMPGPISSASARRPASSWSAAFHGAFQSQRFTIGTSMSATSSGTVPPSPGASGGPPSPSSAPPSRSIASSSASSAARWAISFSRGANPAVLLWAAAAAYAAGFSALSVLRQDAFNTGRFDMGNMVQAVWSTAHGHFLRVTSLQGEQISRLAAHFDPILVLFAPLWWIWPSPDMLLVVQAVAVALGALPVYWLGRKHLRSERAGLGFALAYLLYPAVQWLTLNEFHPVALACPLLLFSFWYLDEDRLLAFAALAVLAATTKEEIALVIAFFGIWYAVRRRRWVPGGAIASAGVAVSA